jgi:hypothetical protein
MALLAGVEELLAPGFGADLAHSNMAALCLVLPDLCQVSASL